MIDRWIFKGPRGAAPCIAAAVAFLLGAGCGKPAADDAANAPPPATTVPPEVVLMEKGLTQLYQTGDPFGAVVTFQEVLKLNPSHYGAHFQLARALDRSAAPTEARLLWEQVAQQADVIKDTTTAATARGRLALPDTASQEAMMVLGLSQLYKTNDPAAAAAQFRKVLERNPTHYGARFQLAKALDGSGQRAEARAEWEKVLKSAEAIKDQATADTARGRLRPTR